MNKNKIKGKKKLVSGEWGGKKERGAKVMGEAKRRNWGEDEKERSNGGGRGMKEMGR